MNLLQSFHSLHTIYTLTSKRPRCAALLVSIVFQLLAVILTPQLAVNGQSLLPDQDLYDFQLFAPPDLQEYEIHPEASEGMFFTYDRLYLGITVPRYNEVATTNSGNYLIPQYPISPQTVAKLNNDNIAASASTGGGTGIIGGLYTFGADPLQLDLRSNWMKTAMSWGNRYEGGWIYDHRGMLFSYFDSGFQEQDFQSLTEFAASSPTQELTQSQASGGNNGGGGVGGTSIPQTTTTITAISPPPDHLIAQKLTQKNQTRIQSAGAAYIIRKELGGRGSRSTARFAFGPRFLQVEDRFTLGYESNQYSFNVPGGAGNTGGQQGGQQGGIGGQVGGGNINSGFSQRSSGDAFEITGIDSITGQGAGTPLQAGLWQTYTTNNMVGPEFSVLFQADRGRWTYSSEFKFTAAFNWQNNIYRGSNFPESLGADYLRATFTPATTLTQTTGTATPVTIEPPPLFLQLYGVAQQNTTNTSDYRFNFSPIGEWRFGAKYRVSQAISLNAGYTGMWMAGIARASTNTGYRTDEKSVKYAEPLNPLATPSSTNPWVVKTTGTLFPGSPIGSEKPNPTYNRIGPADGQTEYVFTNGLDFGVEVKY